MKRTKHPLLMLMAAAIGLLSLAFFSPRVLAGKPVQPPPDPGIRYRIDLFLPSWFYHINNNGQILGCREDPELSDRVGIFTLDAGSGSGVYHDLIAADGYPLKIFGRQKSETVYQFFGANVYGLRADWQWLDAQGMHMLEDGKDVDHLVEL